MDRRKRFFAVGIVVIVTLGLASYLVSRKPSEEVILPDEPVPDFSSEPEPEENTSVTPEEPETATFFLEDEDQEPEKPLPSLDTSDARVRQALGKLTQHPVTARASGIRHLIRKSVTAVDLISRDQNPFSQLFFLQPDGAVRITEEFGRTFLSEDNYARYEGLVTAFESIDENKLVRMYRFFHPLVEEAFGELAYPDTSWEATLDHAIESILDAPEPTGRLEVMGAHGVFMFADQELEALPPVHKLMLRMGPDNARRVKEKLRRLRRALNR